MGGAMMKGAFGNTAMHMQQQQHCNGNRKRWNVYLVTLIVLLLFGSAVLGLMAIHRLRDRRIFNLLIKDKDDQIDSLQIRLQREAENVQDGRMKIEELRMKIYSLRAQKKELHGKIQQLQSTISSLKQEAATLESTIEEHQNETRLLKEQCSQFESLTELLRHKDAEIEDLRHRLQLRATNLPGKMTAEGSLKNDTSRFVDRESSGQAGEARESENGSLAQNAGGRVESEKLVNLGRNMERNSNSETESTDKAGNKEQRHKDEANGTDGEGLVREGESNSESIRILSSRGGDDPAHENGVKLELENQDNKSSRLKGYLKRSMGKRWRTIRGETERTSSSGSDEAAKETMEDRQGMKDDKARHEQVNTENIEDSPPGSSSQNNGNHIDPENVNQSEAKDAALDISNQVENGQQFTNTSSASSHGSLNEVPHHGSYRRTSELSNGGSEQHLQVSEHSNEQDSIIRQQTEDTTDVPETSRKTKAEIDESQEDDTKLKNSGETEIVSSISRESASSVAESNKEHGTQAEEPEF